ncbi:hypothetical protein FQA39_LY14612 [Lamprigera yunnana]|nr:hypothetical protein FQA39_LY14612 [Lamprigera yunnana]
MFKLIFIVRAICIVFTKELPDSIINSWNKLMASYVDDCIAESNVNPDHARNVFTTLYLPDEPEFECYFKCIYRNLTFHLPSSEFHKPYMVETVDHLTDKLADKSIAIANPKSNECHKEYKLAYCVNLENEVD